MKVKFYYICIGILVIIASLAIIFTTWKYILLFFIAKDYVPAGVLIILYILEMFILNYLVNKNHEE